MWLVMLTLPDRVIVDPLPPALAEKYCFRDGQRLPWSAGAAFEARPGTVWEKLLPTEWRWLSEVTAGLDGRLHVSGAAVLPELKKRSKVYKPVRKRRKGAA